MKLLSESFDKKSKKDIKRLQDILVYLGAKIADDAAERMTPALGEHTTKALIAVKETIALPRNARVNKSTIVALNQRAIEKYYASKTQTANLHRTLVKAARIAKLEIDLSEDMKTREQGLQTSNALRQFQKKYGLKGTGALNKETLERLVSVAASRVKPMKKLKVARTERLMKVRYPIRLNMKKSKVADLQKALVWIGCDINASEADAQVYGKTTRKAVISFQTEHGLPVSGNVGFKTAQKINRLIAGNARMVSCKDKYRIRGSVRNSLWEGTRHATVQVFEKRLRDNVLLGERKTLSNGFYDLQYAPPIDPLTGKPRTRFQLLVRCNNSQDNVIKEKIFHVTGKVLWANFTEGQMPYKGKSDFQTLDKLLNKALGQELSIAKIEESDTHKDVSYLRKETGLSAEDVMKMTLAARIAEKINVAHLTAEVFYAFIRQNLPHNIPGDLLPDHPEEWNTWISMLVERCADGIALMERPLQEDTLNSALKQNYISRQVAKDMPQVLDALSVLQAHRVLEKPLLDGNGSLKTLLEVSAIAPNKQTAVASAFCRSRGFTPEFWQSLGRISGIKKSDIEDLRVTTDIGHITSTFKDMTSFLKGELGASRFSGVQDFAKLTTDDWVSLIDKNSGKLPSWIEGANTATKKQVYASLLRQRAEQQFPAVSFVAQIDRSAKHALGSVSGILSAIEAKQDFNLKKDPCAALFESTGSGFSENEVAATKVLQRIHRIAPDAQTGLAMIQSGYYSAAQVCRKGKQAFAAAMKQEGVHADMAIKAYDACENQYGTVLALIGNFHFGLQWVNPGCISPQAYTAREIDELSKQIPDLETLFGPMDIREVRHCESVLGPGAYLTDLFRFLDQKQARPANRTVKDILFERRPDLGNIKLNCRNTDTALAYIDLVCELLEDRVMDGDGSLAYQTTWSAADLLAEPEHITPDAYERLKLADFPLHSHFNLWQEETRMFLSHLGIPRHHLMETFLIDASPAGTHANSADTAGEYFGISDQQLQVIITERATLYWQKRYWSNDVLGAQIPVSVFLQKSGLTYHQLLELLQCAFVNGQAPQSVVLCPVDDCDLDLQKLTHMPLDRLDRINRFLRLWRSSGHALWELDLLIMAPALGNGAVNSELLIALKQFETVRNTLELGVEACAALIGPINNRVRAPAASSDETLKTLFEHLFLSGSIEPQVFNDLRLLLSTASTTKHIDPYLPHIMTSLSCSRDEMSLLLPLTDHKLTLDTLSILFRYITLARKLKSTLPDLLAFFDLAGISDPFGSPDTIARIIRDKGRLKKSGATLAQAAYLLTAAKDASAGWRDTVYVQKTQGLREALAGLRDQIAKWDQAGDDRLKMLLAMLTPFEDAGRLQTAMDIIAGTWPATQTEITDFITEHFTRFIPDATDAIAHLGYTGPVTPGQLEDRRAYCMEALLNYFNRTTIKEFVAVTFGLESSQADVLLNGLHLPSRTERLLAILQDEKLHARDDENRYRYAPSPEALPDIFAALHLVHKASFAARCLKCDRDELAWLVANPAFCGTLDFNLLPLQEAQAAIPLNAWLQTWRFLKFKRNFPEPENASFLKVLELAATPSTPAQAINEALCKVTGWDTMAHEQLHHSQLDYCSPDTYEWFLECHRQKTITGSDFPSLFKLAKRDPDGEEQEKARMARDMAQAKYSRAQWLTVLKPMMDTLREKKRDALTAYLIEKSQREKSPEITVYGKKIANPEYWRSPVDLYGWFLIDVEMCSDQLTSRIKQAILSTQLFVQRCFLNLESRHVEVALPDPDQENNWNQWKWMKNYRIWEANRKVFLYPENWIEPELRDTKSPFFEALETDILSTQITNRNVEGALQRYILKLEEVSRLEICSLFHEKDPTTDRLHVVARTRSMPAAFYYRNYDLYYSRWSPWEKIENDIQSDHVVPWVYNRKLHLFWLIFHDKPIKLKRLPPVKPSDEPVQNPEPAKMLEIELAWCVRQSDGWDARKISKKKLIHPWERPTFSYNLKPRYKDAEGCLYLDIYISTSKEFNDATFYDQFKHAQARLTKVHYNETLRPWHSSSFVFNGAVKDVLLRGIPGNYFSPDAGDMRNISSYDHVKANFGEAAADISLLN
ncbi:MAG: hypothetical protein HKP58_00855, partial [Desulfatitalea sp.]|nr:peptidoglycan-binding protein [Desulfatitalea sp.]NNJ98934.1 hypothetical protein [Desulfatitalea sp.]